MTTVETHKYHTLDALRGIAAIAVMIGHVKILASDNLNFFGSYLAVDLFYLLSGFVIARAYVDKLAGGLSVSRFMLIRLIRLWPMMFVGAALGGLQIALFPTPLDGVGGPLDLASLTMLAALFLPALPHWHFTMFPVNDPEWTVFYELLINLAFAAGAWRLRGRALIAILVVTALLEAVMVHHYGALNTGWAATQYPQGLVRVTLPFLMGAALYRTRDRWAHRMPRVPIAVLLAALPLAMFVPGFGWWRPPYDMVFVLVFTPALIMLASQVEPGPALRRVSIWLGEMSYPLYAIHFPLNRALVSLTGVTGRAHAIAGLGLMIVLLAACGPLARLYDAPLRALLSRRLLAPRPTPAVA